MVETDISDEPCLKKALDELKLPFEVHDDPVRVVDYAGRERLDKQAHIIIRKEHVKGPWASDIGFERQSDGNFKVHINDMSAMGGKLGGVLKDLMQTYSKHRSVKFVHDEEDNVDIDDVSTEDKVKLRVRIYN